MLKACAAGWKNGLRNWRSAGGVGTSPGGGHAGERVLEGNRRVREAQKAVEVLERELQGMGGAVQVKQEGGDNDDDIVELGEVVVDEKDEERRANPGVKREEEEGGGEGGGDGEGEGDDTGGVLRITDWMRNRLGSSLAAKAANFPCTREMVGPNPPPPLDACVLRAPPPTIYTLRWLLQRILHKQLHCKEQRDCRWRREEGSAPRGVPVSWVTGPGTGRTAPLPNNWLPSKAQGGKFLTAGPVSAGSCHWHLIFERWADHGLGEVGATPRKDTVLFRANWTRILRDGIYVVEDKGKYHGFVVGQTLSRPGALRVKCEDDAQRRQQSADLAIAASVGGDQGERGHARAGMPPRKRVHMANRAQKCTWLACRCIVPATFQTVCSGNVSICHQKTFEKSFESCRNSLLERRWNTHPGYPPCRWRASRSTLRTRAPFG